MKKIILFCVIVFTILIYFGYLESKRKANISYTKTYPTQLSSISSGNLPESVLLNKKYCYPDCDSDVDSSYRFTDDYKFYFSLAGKTIRKGTWTYSGDAHFTNGFVKTYDNDGKSWSQDIQVISENTIKVNSTIYKSPIKSNELSSSTKPPTCISEEAKSFAIEKMRLNGRVASAEISNMGNNKWGVTGLVYTRIGHKTMMLVVGCNNGSYEVLSSNIL